MNGIKRKIAIYNLLLEQQSIEVNELAALFAVTPQTIRRDLAELNKMGVAEVHYGGATLSSNPNAELIYSYKETQQLQHKELICQKAADLVNSNNVVAIDKTAALQMLTYLRKYNFYIADIYV